jgi:serine protease Do
MTGAKVENLSPAVAMDVQADMMAHGVVVVDAAGGSIAANYGFQTGDIVRAVNGATIGNVGALTHALGRAQQWNMVIERGGRKLTLNVGG